MFGSPIDVHEAANAECLIHPHANAYFAQFPNLSGDEAVALGQSIEVEPRYMGICAYDMGSGATKIKAVHVNLDTNEVEETLYSDSLPLLYRQDLEWSLDNCFSDMIQEIGMASLSEAKQTIDQLSPYPVEHVAVATAAFRSAQNGQEYANSIMAETGISVNILSQAQEGQMAFFGAKDHAQSMGYDDIVVWDIGGGSMQFTYQDDLGHFWVMGGELASISFQHVLQEAFKAKGIEHIHPMGEDNALWAIEWVKEKLCFEASAKEVIIDHQIHQGAHVFGVGSVHNKTIMNFVNRVNGFESDHYTRSMLFKTIQVFCDKDIQEIHGLLGTHLPVEYAQNQLSNMILVYGAMEKFGIERVYPLPSNNVDGIIALKKQGLGRPLEPFISPPEKLIN